MAIPSLTCSWFYFQTSTSSRRAGLVKFARVFLVKKSIISLITFLHQVVRKPMALAFTTLTGGCLHEFNQQISVFHLKQWKCIRTLNSSYSIQEFKATFEGTYYFTVFCQPAFQNHPASVLLRNYFGERKGTMTIKKLHIHRRCTFVVLIYSRLVWFLHLYSLHFA